MVFKSMNKTLIIIFVKNSIPGTVKTRLASAIGNQGAFEIYNTLVDLTRQAVKNLEADKHVYFSKTVEETHWDGFEKHVQQGNDLGARMHNAFQNGFQKGYERIALIGSDLPDISTKLIESAFHKLGQNELVFGPAQDGGYYLIGMSKLHVQVFQNKPWSTAALLETTLNELEKDDIAYSLLETLNDIDTLEDLQASAFYKNNTLLQSKIK